MRYHRETDNRLIVGLERGEDLRSSIETLSVQFRIESAYVSAIGALKDPELGYYDLSKKEYIRRRFLGIWELISLQGNISLYNTTPLFHAHVSIGGSDFQVFGGHFFNGTIGVVAEIHITPMPTPLHRLYCESIGLPRWEPGIEKKD
ncbi:MAG: DNA-binding protein [bacterium]|nr:DNA-binding protein [bacterium]